MFLVRSARNTHLVDEGELRVTHPDINRRASHQPFPELGTLVESTGKKNKTHVWLYARNTIASGGETTSLRSDASLRGAESNKIVRRINDLDLARLADYDQAVEQAREALKVAREERKDFIAKAWRRGDKTVSASELARMAEQNANDPA